jgi:uncharacterized membrane protein YccC
MPDSAVALLAARRFRVRLPRPPPGASGQPWLPKWSAPAALRALRATIVVPGVFALTFKVIGNPQMALFASFGSFASLVLVSFGGTRRDKAIAHLGLAIVGTALIAIGTAVSGITWLAVVVTVPVAFAVFFAGVAGPNGASGVTGALLAYVLPVASSGTAGTIPARLAGWWLASALSTAAVLLLSPKPPGDRLRAAAATLAAALAGNLKAAVSGYTTGADVEAPDVAKSQLMNIFEATPYQPTGLATADQGLANVVHLLEAGTSLVSDTLDGHLDVQKAAPSDRELLSSAAELLEDVSRLLSGQDVSTDEIRSGLSRLDRARTASTRRSWSPDSADDETTVAIASQADAIALGARAAVTDAMIATRRADPATVAAQRRSWAGVQAAGPPPAGGKLTALAGALGVAAEQRASLRSLWFRNSARGAVAIAAAVAVADLTNLQHAFWVVLGTLSVLRSNASATGSTALRALAGTVLGFAVGAAVLLGIGTGQTALWIALPIAVLVTAYAPGTAPFTVGQAGFTTFVVVLFNLLVPVGWTVGLLRIEDIALGCGVSIVVGLLFWPRGAGSVVGDDLADAFRQGAAYLTQAVDWSLGLQREAPGAAQAVVGAWIRLDDALRGFLAEQGAKRVSKQDLWRLVMGTTRLRLTAFSVASLRGPDGARGGTDGTGDASGHADDTALGPLLRETAGLAGFYQDIAAEVGPPHRNRPPQPVAVPALADGQSGAAAAGRARGADLGGPAATRAQWIGERLSYLTAHAPEITLPAEHLAQQRRIPWWR